VKQVARVDTEIRTVADPGSLVVGGDTATVSVPFGSRPSPKVSPTRAIPSPLTDRVQFPGSPGFAPQAFPAEGFSQEDESGVVPDGTRQVRRGEGT
jgi:hypothetical protein